jgi:hypothetical protein
MTNLIRAHTYQRKRVPSGFKFADAKPVDAECARRWDDELTHEECQEICGRARVALDLANNAFRQIAPEHREKIEKVMKEKP